MPIRTLTLTSTRYTLTYELSEDDSLLHARRELTRALSELERADALSIESAEEKRLAAWERIVAQ